MLKQTTNNLLYFKTLFYKYQFSFFLQFINYTGQHIVKIRKEFASHGLLLLKVKVTYLRYFFKSSNNLLNYQNNIYLVFSNDLIKLLYFIKQYQKIAHILLFGLLSITQLKKKSFDYLYYILNNNINLKFSIEFFFLKKLKQYPAFYLIKMLSLRIKE